MKIPNNQKQVAQKIEKLIGNLPNVESVVYDDGSVLINLNGSEERYEELRSLVPSYGRIGDGGQEGEVVWFLNGEIVSY